MAPKKRSGIYVLSTVFIYGLNPLRFSGECGLSAVRLWEVHISFIYIPCRRSEHSVLLVPVVNVC